MSSIPNNAMPHAVAEPEAETEESKSSFLLDGAQRLADKAREIPVSKLAIGAGVVAATAADRRADPALGGAGGDVQVEVAGPQDQVLNRARPPRPGAERQIKALACPAGFGHLPSP